MYRSLIGLLPMYNPPGSQVQWIPRLPSPILDSLLFEASGSRLYVCGGKNKDGLYTENCYRYTYTSSQYKLWKQINSLDEFREYSGQTVISKYKLHTIRNAFFKKKKHFGNLYEMISIVELTNF